MNQNQQLLEKILAQGFPTSRDEQWKYTNISAIAAKPFKLAPSPSASLRGANASKQSSYIISENYLIFVNGYNISSSFSDTDKNKINITPLDKINTENLSSDIFENLNQYFFQEGCVMNIQKTLKYPLQILYINTEDNWVQPRNQINLKNNTTAVIIEDFMSTNASIMNIVSNIDLENNAKLTYIKIQQENHTAYHIGKTNINLQENAVAKTFTFSTGSQLARSDIHIKLIGEGAHTALYGLYMSKNRTHLDQHTVIEHLAKKTKSEEIYHGIVKDQSRAVFNGKVIVHPHASHTEAVQENHNLLLSSEAEIDTKPELEIYCDDIKCSHGATIGQLDEDALFYLRARGLDEISAKNILISAVSNKMIDYIPQENLREILRGRLHD